MQWPKGRSHRINPYIKAMEAHTNIFIINENSGTLPWNTQVIPVSYALDGECE